MKFYTDITTNASNLCLLHINKWKKYLKIQNTKKEILLDPGVYELKKSNEYSHVKMLHKLADYRVMPEWFHMSIDYPQDMNPKYGKEFIQKTNTNNYDYFENPHYLTTLQFNVTMKNFRAVEGDFNSFKLAWDINKSLMFGKWLGVGGLCRFYAHTSKAKLFLTKIAKWIVKHKDVGFTNVHFYGLGLESIRIIAPILDKAGIEWSTDSTKWTRACTNQFKLNNGVCCRKHNRDQYFLEYMKLLKTICKKVEF